MTRVDFYVLTDQTSVEQFACILVNKVIRQGMDIHIHTDSKQFATRLDELLWTFRDISFIPHALTDDQGQGAVPVTIGWPDQSVMTDQVLINLGSDIPNIAPNFDRIIEIVSVDEDSRARSRGHFRQYREQGFDLHSHDLESNYANA